nr:protein_phosphatase_type_1_regulator-like_protein/GeneDB:LmjF.05.1210 [Leishmania donovani]
MPELEEFWLTDGNINDWGEVKKFCGFANTLRTIYVERNPIEQDKRYRDKVYMNLPFVTQIDSWPVVNKGNLEADRLIQRRAS